MTSFQGIVGRDCTVGTRHRNPAYFCTGCAARLCGCSATRNRSEIVATFLAVLELSKTRRIRLEGDGEEMELMLTNDNTK